MNSVFLIKKITRILHLVSHSIRTSIHSTLLHEPKPSRFAKKICDSVLPPFIMFVHQNLLGMSQKWTNVEGKYVHKVLGRE